MKLLLKNINDLAAKQKSEGLTAFEKRDKLPFVKNI